MSSSSIASKNSSSSMPGATQLVDDDDDMFSLDFTVPSKWVEEVPVVDASGEPSVVTVVHSVDPCVEQAARLYANGQADAARVQLEAAVRGGDAVEMAWNMLLDLYRVIGEQVPFEKLALEYVARFEKSPPSWSEPQGAKATAQSAERRASVVLNGALNAGCEPQFAQLERLVVSKPVLRLDLAKLQDADDGGCSLLLQALKASKKARHEIVFGSAEHLVDLLKNKVAEGKRENESIWLLLLELYQRLGQSQAFEDLALQYAITFEVSPPSWEMPKAQSGAAKGVAAKPVVTESQDTLQLTGDILDAVPGIAFMDIAEACAQTSGQDIVIDVGQLRRIDVASAYVLLDTLKSLAEKGSHASIRGTGPLVAALFDVVGIAQVALVAMRRF
jgi:anti-anti-sigma regulatory factor